jgi:hypothetical protein
MLPDRKLSTVLKQTKFKVNPKQTYLRRPMNSLYRYLCLLDKSQKITFSVFVGNCFSTSDFRRRKMNGRRTLWSLWTTAILKSPLFSIMSLIGLLNQSLKSLREEKTVGMRKWSRDQSSIRLFCSGVPVSNRRRRVRKFIRVLQRWLSKFFMCWAWNWKVQLFLNGANLVQNQVLPLLLLETSDVLRE